MHGITHMMSNNWRPCHAGWNAGLVKRKPGEVFPWLLRNATSMRCTYPYPHPVYVAPVPLPSRLSGAYVVRLSLWVRLRYGVEVKSIFLLSGLLLIHCLNFRPRPPRAPLLGLNPHWRQSPVRATPALEILLLLPRTSTLHASTTCAPTTSVARVSSGFRWTRQLRIWCCIVYKLFPCIYCSWVFALSLPSSWSQRRSVGGCKQPIGTTWWDGMPPTRPPRGAGGWHWLRRVCCKFRQLYPPLFERLNTRQKRGSVFFCLKDKRLVPNHDVTWADRLRKLPHFPWPTYLCRVRQRRGDTHRTTTHLSNTRSIF